MPFPFYGAPWRGTPAKGRLRCPCPPHPFPAVKFLSSCSCPSLSLSVVFLFLFLTNIFSPFFCYNFLLFPPLSAPLLPLSAQHQWKCVKGVTSFVLRNTGSRDELKDSVPQEHASSVFREVVVVSFCELFSGGFKEHCTACFSSCSCSPMKKVTQHYTLRRNLNTSGEKVVNLPAPRQGRGVSFVPCEVTASLCTRGQTLLFLNCERSNTDKNIRLLQQDTLTKHGSF